MNCYINLYRHLATDDFNRVLQAPSFPTLASFVIPISYKSTQSAVFPLYSKFIEICPDNDIYIDVGTNPKATNMHLIRGGERVIYGTEAGQKIAIIEA